MTANSTISGTDCPQLPDHVFSLIGSCPGTDPIAAARETVGAMSSHSTSVLGLPAVVELPERGPHGGMWGRAGAMLVDIGLEYDSDAWQVVSRPGSWQRKAKSLLTQDLEAFALAVHAEGTASGWVKTQICGPWTLGSGVRRGALGDGLADAGLMTDLAGSLAEGVNEHISQLQELLPGINIVAQIDEPAMALVHEGKIPTTTGYGNIPAIESERLALAVETVIQSARAGGAAHVVMHSCAPTVPWDTVRRISLDGLSLHAAALASRHDWEEIATFVEGGGTYWAGLSLDQPSNTPTLTVQDVVQPVIESWRNVGLERHRLHAVVNTPACGLLSQGTAGATRSRIGFLASCGEAFWEYAENG